MAHLVTFPQFLETTYQSINEQYNNWTVVARYKKPDRSRYYYLMRCKCSYQTESRHIDSYKLGKSKQCINCAKKKVTQILPGDVFGSWTIIKQIANSKWQEAQYIANCICGKEKIVRKYDLLKKKSIRCHSCAISSRNTTHNKAKTRTYRIWAGMKYRCNNIKNKSYKWYGGRGITYEKRWEFYENFYQDMGESPPGLTLDRIDPDGNYTKENCRWVTSAENQKNKRNSAENANKFVWIKKELLCNNCRVHA